jgi:CheY-like chemotaxis protein
VVVGDASRLEQIVSNLLVNAVKFTPKGRTVHVSLAQANGQAELVIADEGIGIEPEFMPHLFQRFRQADTGHTRRHGGLGLGLSIVSVLVQLHQGEVRAASDGPDKGATFTVRLPVATGVTVSTQAETRQNAAAMPGPDPLEGVRVLVVDDEADLRGAVSELLMRAGASVRALESGAVIESAIDEFRPDVLVLDIGMPGEDGYSLIRRIRRLPSSSGGDIPAISLTAHALEEDRRHAIDSGFQEHLPKPVNLPLLVAAISKLVADHGAALSDTGT